MTAQTSSAPSWVGATVHRLGTLVTLRAGAADTQGAFVPVPAGTPRRFRDPSSRPARVLALNMPGGTHERLFAEAGEPVADAARFPPLTPPDKPRLVAAALRHGITVLPPP